MRILKPAIVFVLAFLGVIEIFLAFDIYMGLIQIIPIAAVIGIVVALTSDSLAHWGRMLFIKDYKHFMRDHQPNRK